MWWPAILIVVLPPVAYLLAYGLLAICLSVPSSVAHVALVAAFIGLVLFALQIEAFMRGNPDEPQPNGT